MRISQARLAILSALFIGATMLPAIAEANLIYSNEAIIFEPVDENSFNIMHCFLKSKEPQRPTPEPIRMTLDGASRSEILEDKEHYNCQARNHEPIAYSEVGEHIRQARLDIETFFGKLVPKPDGTPGAERIGGLPGDMGILEQELNGDAVKELPEFRIRTTHTDLTRTILRAGLTEFEYPFDRALPPNDALMSYTTVRFSPFQQGGNRLEAHEGDAEQIMRDLVGNDKLSHIFKAFGVHQAMAMSEVATNKALNDSALYYLHYGLVYLEIADFVNSHRKNNPECLRLLADLQEELNIATRQAGIPADITDLTDVLESDKFTAMTEADFKRKSVAAGDGDHEVVTANECTRRLLAVEQMILQIKKGAAGRNIPTLAKVMDIYKERIEPQLHTHILPAGPATDGTLRAD